MNRILLMGNPNVGKSAIFSRITGAKVMVSNYPGSTVEMMQGILKTVGGNSIIIDVPGTYTLSPTCKAEEVAVRMLKEGDVIINVVDATNLERNLGLTLQLLGRDIPVIVALNMWDETRHKGIAINLKKLEEMLKIPVVPVCGLSGEGLKELINRLPETKTIKGSSSSENKRWEKIGQIVDEVQTLSHRHHTLLERLEDLSIHPFTGIMIALFVIFFIFFGIRLIGENLISFIFDPVFMNFYSPLVIKLSVFLKDGTFLHYLLIGNLLDGKIDFTQSFGLLTTGLYVPIAMVLPYLFSFYLILGLLEDFGYLPRFAVLADNFMHHFGLHGYAIIPMMLCLGCKVAGVLGIRVLEERREKFIAATMMSIAVPCMAQIAMIVGLVGQRGMEYLWIVFLTLLSLLIVKGVILNKILPGNSPEILIEIPPYRIPQIQSVIKKLGMRLFSFLREALPLVFLGILFINLLHTLKIINYLNDVCSPILTGLWGLPKEAMNALIVGFLRKDVAVGMLAPLNLSTKQLIISSTILAIYFPCIATFVVLIRELGIKDMLKISLIMAATALSVGAFLNVIL